MGKRKRLRAVKSLGTCKVSGKQQYASRADASTKRRQQYSTAGKVYPCPHCGRWHIAGEPF